MILSYIFVLCMWLEPTAVEASAQTNSSAVAMATAGAGRAAIVPNEAASLNPATLAHLRGRDLHSAYFGDEWSVGLSENSYDTVIPAAFKFNRRKWKSGSKEYIESDLRLAMGQFLAERWAFGVTAHQRDFQLGEASWKGINVDVGTMLVFNRRFSTALVFYDLFSPRADDLPSELRPSARTGIGATLLLSELVRLRVDHLTGPEHTWTRGTTMLGYESFISQWLVVRMGLQSNREREIELATAGFGLELPRFRLNYAYQTGITTGLEDVHSVDLGIPF